MDSGPMKRALFPRAAIVCCFLAFAPAAFAQTGKSGAAGGHGYLGVEVRDLTAREASALGWTAASGAVLKKVEPGSPAAEANLVRGDIVTKVNGQPVADTDEFLRAIAAKAPGTVVKVQFLRQGRLRTGPVKLGDKPSEAVHSAASAPEPPLGAPFEMAQAETAAGPENAPGKPGQAAGPDKPPAPASAAAGDFRQLERTWHEAQDPEQQIPAIEALLALEPQIEPWPLAEPRGGFRAGLLAALGKAYTDRREGSRAANREKAYEAAAALLAIHSPSTAPERWAAAQDNLGNALRQRVLGNAAENVERAIAAYEQALAVYTREAFPEAWAGTQHHLGMAWTERTRGEQPDNQQKAIAAFEAALTVLTRDAAPAAWAETQHALAVIYRQYARGSKEENIERAIAAFEAVLAVRTREANPKDWAATKHQLAVAYRNRVRGDKAENIEQAISLYQEALAVRTHEAIPDGWAQTQAALTTAYSYRVRGDKSENGERSIAAAEAALTVYTREDFPREWASAQYTLASSLERRAGGDKAENLDRAIAAYRAALTVYSPDAYPNDWGLVQHALGSVYEDRIRGDAAENIENAIEAVQAALTVRTREAAPEKWARSASLLGRLYRNRMRGSKTQNLDRSVEALEGVLAIYPRQTAPGDWAVAKCSLAATYMAHPLREMPEIAERVISVSEECLSVDEKELPANARWLTLPQSRAPVYTSLAVALADRMRGDRAENIERAIEVSNAALAVYSRGEAPGLWGEVTANLGNYYSKRLRGDRAANLEKAIAVSREALSVFSPERSPLEWGRIHGNLCYAYDQRLQGARTENIEQAIGACKDALAVLDPATSLSEWVNAQNNLAGAYRQRIRGEHAENMELAIAALESALKLLAGETASRQRAQIQLNLSLMYSDRSRGSRAENMERAITTLEAAMPASTREQEPERWAYNYHNYAALLLGRIKGDPEGNNARAIEALERAGTIFTRDQFPQQWGKGQILLASVYAKRAAGDPKENVNRAILASEAALTVLTRDAYPAEWAMVRLLQASYYTSDKLGPAGAENFGRAIAACQDALTVFTRDAYPGPHRLAAATLGSLYLKKREWRKADEAYSSAREAFLLLFGEGLNEAEARSVLTDDMFSEAAYAAAQVGDSERAFALLDEGKARLLGVTLKLDRLDLDAADQERLQTLRPLIRQSEAAYQRMTGQEKAAAIAALTPLRDELLALVIKGTRASGDDVLTRAASVVPEGGALVAPLFVKDGGADGLADKLLIVTVKDGRPRIGVAETPPGDPARKGEQEAAFRDWARVFQPGLSEAESAAALENLPTALDKISPELWLALGQTLTNALAEAGVNAGSPVTILPLGPLGLVPIGLAQNPDTGRRLMDGYPIAYAPSVTALVSAKERVGRTPAAPSLTAIVNPTGDLPFTPVEAALVGSRFDGARRGALVQTEASPASVLAAIKSSDYWHFASHGFFDRDDPKSSGLMMAGMQPLTIQMLMTAEGLKGPRLAVLSACETGIYDVKNNANEFVGLPSALLRLGAGGVISSLWPVNDLSTALLLARFYDLHRGEDQPPVVALQRAQIWLRGATASELSAYAGQAIGEGRLPQEMAGGLQDAINRGTASRGLATAFARMLRGEAGAAAEDSGGTLDATQRPFANPYYWSGFILTGL